MAANLLLISMYCVLLLRAAEAYSVKGAPACEQECSKQLSDFQEQILLSVKQIVDRGVCPSSSECDEKFRSLTKKLADTEARLERVIQFLNLTAGYTGEEDGDEVSSINICVYLILGGHTKTANINCEDVPDDLFKHIIQTAYSSRVENFQSVFSFLNILKPPRQLAGYAILLKAMSENYQTSTPEIIQLAYRLHGIELQQSNGTSTLSTEEKKLLSQLKAELPDSVRQLFWADWCIILNHNRQYEYVYADHDFMLDEHGYHRVFTWMHGDGLTIDIGYWHLKPHQVRGHEGHIQFQMTNRHHQGLYLAQINGNGTAGRRGCDPRHIHGIKGEEANANVAKDWELIPAFHICDKCFHVKNSGFGTSEYLYAPNNLTFDAHRRHSVTAEIECTDVRNYNAWEVLCVSGDERISLINYTSDQ